MLRHRNFGTKPITRKTFHVIAGMHDPEGVLDFLRMHWGDHPDRTQTYTTKIVTHGEVRDGKLEVLIEYSVRGGHPSDLRRWLGRLIWSDVVGEETMEVRLIKSERLE